MINLVIDQSTDQISDQFFHTQKNINLNINETNRPAKRPTRAKTRSKEAQHWADRPNIDAGMALIRRTPGCLSICPLPGGGGPTAGPFLKTRGGPTGGCCLTPSPLQSIPCKKLTEWRSMGVGGFRVWENAARWFQAVRKLLGCTPRPWRAAIGLEREDPASGQAASAQPQGVSDGGPRTGCTATGIDGGSESGWVGGLGGRGVFPDTPSPAGGLAIKS